MTRKSKRELKRAVDQLADDDDVGDPMEIILTERVVETSHPTDYDGPSVSQTCIRRDDAGNWHTEPVDRESEDGGGS